MGTRWPNVRLGEVLTHRQEFITIDDLTTYRRPRVRLHAQGIVLRDEIVGALIKTKEQQVCRAGELLVAEIDAKVGGFGIVSEALAGSIVSSHYFLFRLGEKLDSRFLDYFVRTPTFREQVSAQGSTNYAAIRPAHVLNYEIPLPQLSEQQAIVLRLDEMAAQIDRACALRSQATALSEALVSRKVTSVFEGLSHYPKEPMRNLGIGGQDPIQTGPFGAQLHASEFTETGVPVLNVGNVWPGGLRLERLDHVDAGKASTLNRYSLRAGDLLFARSGATLGKVCPVPRECDGWLMTGHLFRVRFDESRVANRFAFAALRGADSVREQVFRQVRGATRPGFNTTLLGNVELPIPPLSEQYSIVEKIEAFQAEVDALQRRQSETAVELGGLFPSILNRAFRGEL